MTGDVLPHHAEAWEVIDPEGLELRLKLRPDIFIQNVPPWNGRQWTAHDVAWNLERIAGFTAEDEGIAKVRVPARLDGAESREGGGDRRPHGEDHAVRVEQRVLQQPDREPHTDDAPRDGRHRLRRPDEDGRPRRLPAGRVRGGRQDHLHPQRQLLPPVARTRGRARGKAGRELLPLGGQQLDPLPPEQGVRAVHRLPGAQGHDAPPMSPPSATATTATAGVTRRRCSPDTPRHGSRTRCGRCPGTTPTRRRRTAPKA